MSESETVASASEIRRGLKKKETMRERERERERERRGRGRNKLLYLRRVVYGGNNRLSTLS